MSVTTGNPADATAIRPFTIPEVSDAELEALRARIAATRWPEKETVTDVLDNITLYWLTNTAVSSARLYWENKIGLYNAADVSVPAAISAFPGENYQAPRSWTERAYHNLIYYNRPAAGGHFAAWEQPRVFSAEVRAGLRPLRGEAR